MLSSLRSVLGRAAVYGLLLVALPTHGAAQATDTARTVGGQPVAPELVERVTVRAATAADRAFREIGDLWVQAVEEEAV